MEYANNALLNLTTQNYAKWQLLNKIIGNIKSKVFTSISNQTKFQYLSKVFILSNGMLSWNVQMVTYHLVWVVINLKIKIVFNMI